MNALAPILTPTELLQALRVEVQPDESRPSLREDEMRSRSARSPRWLLVMLSAVAGVAASLLLVPRGPSVDTADRAPVQAKLQAQVSSGDLSAGTMIALAREHERAGDFHEALKLLQEVVGQDPRNVVGWQALADMLHELGRGDDALVALQRAQRLSPTPERGRLIAARQASSRRSTSRTGALTEASPGTAAHDEPVQRAEERLAAGAPKDALALLDGLARARPDALDTRVVALQMQAVLALPAANKRAAAPPDAAASRASAWLKSRPGTGADDALPLAAVLTRAGHHRQAARVLEPWLGEGNASVVAAWSQAMRASGQRDAASGRLARLGRNAAADEIVRQRVRLALDAGGVGAAFGTIRGHGIDRTPIDVLGAWIQAATIDARRLEAHAPQLRELWSLGGKHLQAHDGPLAAQAAWAAGDTQAAAMLADAALARCEGRPDCAMPLARIQHELGRSAQSAQALRTMAGPLDDARLGEYARLSISHGTAAEALAHLERHRRSPPTAHFEAAWAILATAVGRQADVARWLETARADDQSPEALRDLFDAAVHAKAHALTVAVGTKLESRRRMRPADRVLLAQALMDSGRTADALAQWRKVRTATRDYEEAYANALRVALSRGIGNEARQEFARAQTAALARVPASDVARREALVRPLLDLGARAEALSAVEGLALADPERWLQPFESLAGELGRDDRRTAVWRRLAAHPAPGAQQRLHIADSLAAAGQPSAAEPALRILAADASASDPIAQRLVALWGSTLSRDQIDWVEARVLGAGRRAGASDADLAERRAGWMRLLNERGAAARTALLYPRLQPKATSGPVFDAYIEALQRTGQTAAMSRALGGAGHATTVNPQP